jgi:hypothetical protein
MWKVHGAACVRKGKRRSRTQPSFQRHVPHFVFVHCVKVSLSMLPQPPSFSRSFDPFGFYPRHANSGPYHSLSYARPRQISHNMNSKPAHVCLESQTSLSHCVIVKSCHYLSKLFPLLEKKTPELNDICHRQSSHQAVYIVRGAYALASTKARLYIIDIVSNSSVEQKRVVHPKTPKLQTIVKVKIKWTCATLTF